MENFLALRPIFHDTEKRVRVHVALRVLAALIEATMVIDLAQADLRDSDVITKHLTARRALRELERVRQVAFTDQHGNDRQVLIRPRALKAKIFAAFGVDTSTWSSRIARPGRSQAL